MAVVTVDNVQSNVAPGAVSAAGTADGDVKWWALGCFLGVIAASGAAWMIYRHYQPTPITVQAAYVPLAGLVIVAGALERLLEPISTWLLDPSSEQAAADTAKAAAVTAGGDPTKATAAVQTQADAAATAQAALSAKKRVRSIVFWAIASTLGMGVAAGFGFFLVGAVATSHVNTYFDIVVTGLSIGAGTKPFHDLITSIEAKAASTPS